MSFSYLNICAELKGGKPPLSSGKICVLNVLPDDEGPYLPAVLYCKSIEELCGVLLLEERLLMKNAYWEWEEQALQEREHYRQAINITDQACRQCEIEAEKEKLAQKHWQQYELELTQRLIQRPELTDGESIFLDYMPRGEQKDKLIRAFLQKQAEHYSMLSKGMCKFDSEDEEILKFLHLLQKTVNSLEDMDILTVSWVTDAQCHNSEENASQESSNLIVNFSTGEIYTNDFEA